MKKFLRALAFALVIFTFAAVISSCEKKANEYKVALSCPDGVTVTGENPQTVKHGGTAAFTVKIPDGYVFKSCEGAEYNQDTGVLTVRNVTARMYLEFIIEEYGYDRNETFTYVFYGDEKDTTDVLPGTGILSGTRITVAAGDTFDRIFVGWTIGGSYQNGGRLVSSSPVYSFLISPENTDNGVLMLYANYMDVDSIRYDANGGSINLQSENIRYNALYTADVDGDEVTVKYRKNYLSYLECASSFYDDGTFVRSGYVLKEYNTRADGSGRAYSIGSKVPLVLDGSDVTLYCIWAEDSLHADFTYEDISIPYPMLNSSTAPNWRENGIKITGYKGDADEIVIPEMIDGKPVTVLGKGAINGKDVTTLVLSKYLIKVEDGAVQNCDKLSTVYFPDGIYEINNEAFDAASYTSFKKLYVNATIAPRNIGADTGALAVKLSRLIAREDLNRVILIAGSSAYQGFGTEYMERLFGGEYRVINFGTTRTTNCTIYLEAMSELAHDGDVIIYAPENSSYMFGERELYWKTLRDLENMNNIYRHIDISNYTNVFGAFTEFNQLYRYNDASSSGTPHRYEDICTHGSLLNTDGEYPKPTTNKYGDYLYYLREEGVSQKYNDAYFITMDEHVKSKYEGAWNDTDNQHNNKDFTDDSNITWTHITDIELVSQMNSAIRAAKSSGAAVYFGFCPADAGALVDGADKLSHLQAYDALIDNIYEFDGRLGSSADYIYDHSYFYDCAFHLNDTGRALRTYRMYLDLAQLLGIERTVGFLGVGTDYDGCIFEGESGDPSRPWSPTN